MKKIIISIILSLGVAIASAQTNQYPNASGTITRSGYTYKYRPLKIAGVSTTSVVELYNAATTYLDVKWGHKDGSPLSAKDALGENPGSVYISGSSQTFDQTTATINGCFTSQQKMALKGKSMTIVIRVDSSTGKIADVYFSFRRNDVFANIPVETYRSVELALKQNLTFTVTAHGRTMNYLQFIWEQEFRPEINL